MLRRVAHAAIEMHLMDAALEGQAGYNRSQTFRAVTSSPLCARDRSGPVYGGLGLRIMISGT